MSERTTAELELVTTTVPQGWRQTGRPGELTYSGIGGSRPPRVSVQAQTATAQPIEEVSLQIMSEVQAEGPQALVLTCDVWPHPVWGVGRLIQSARVQDGQTLAHDLYLFVAGEKRITFHVDCLLADLLSIEEDVAAIVASTRPDGEESR
ncbi:hypothetical protein [Gephyromycinifex aptenodytis]|uniref:hypothetical protein n=1 Tax=Gephyromycinifex aptenodytis TaxID=2716227 RepID=UPI0014459954|nr:hypothetical protein [Gephyromycinifex aptenodytis]